MPSNRKVKTFPISELSKQVQPISFNGEPSTLGGTAGPDDLPAHCGLAQLKEVKSDRACFNHFQLMKILGVCRSMKCILATIG